MSVPTVLVTGVFQDPIGHPYAYGTITFQLSVDAFDTSINTAISSKEIIKGSLDSGGSIVQPFNIWPNSLLTPTTYYKVKVYTHGGLLAWFSPVIIPNTSSVDIGTIIPQI
jgi:hypothetical protein